MWFFTWGLDQDGEEVESALKTLHEEKPKKLETSNLEIAKAMLKTDA